ncbi:undecaprenyldiphospho-muramoylpentapeptide beta-N-acetylglucosaminyltransferase [Arcticibacterium luteifluviistationis]|uniref:UDP-N-acetylglucosamine--N-acetylmuramyl-(pentapeptide) pyrophosphoryl-undecaprenol N-acetylglucosamine transferase n=1 Tax=Arcticibacterium luteifluviistationis TaxID=1784714 RepID=A0A2Z4GGE7_9BACT|nr:undecaprenyldiphospho-muramoylpentapeptide beta-N-acetylglucosaminyltransferase [Arcticibacterium luteifluviistationis]AWW00075.1 undecaprenyldiphospho-muramoylpentapeptide beta-N-acetylglucosaminyltransferase [Arcticibacterium luteifluviistationis]
MSKPYKIIISGGGTGGHIYPAIAIANELKSRSTNIEILFVGAEGKMEMEKVPKAGFEIIGLPIAGINRSNMLANLKFPFKLINSLRLAYKTITTFKPDAAIGVGGYASGPTLLMANFKGVKTLLQEQNSYAGITNKFLSKRASKICVAYPKMEAFFPSGKIVFTGNPVRKDIIESNKTRKEALAHFGLSENKKTLLIIGGSQGARSINKAIEAGLSDLNKAGLQVIWQTGKNFKSAFSSDSQNCISEFIYEMDLAYKAADIAISRAGALSVSELCLTNKPSILVPLPSAAEDHQTMNAMSLVNENAALLVKDVDVSQELVKATIDLAGNSDLQSELSNNIKAFAKPKAAEEIVNEILSLI